MKASTAEWKEMTAKYASYSGDITLMSGIEVRLRIGSMATLEYS